MTKSQRDPKNRSTTVQKPPAANLPKGGGAIQGIGEKFSVNAVNGTNTLAIPLPTAAARDGFSPALGLVYSSGFGNGLFGLGWSTDTPAITRKTDQELPRYLDGEESDTFILSNAEDLVPLLQFDPVSSKWKPEVRETAAHRIRQYRPRIEGMWARIEQWQSKSTGVIHWRTITPNNVTAFYGSEVDTYIADPADPARRIFEWRLSHTFDDKGNLIVYRYKREDFAGVEHTVFEQHRSAASCTNLYLKRVLYGNKTPYHAGDPLPLENDFLFETVFDYGEHDPERPLPNDSGEWGARRDAFSTFRSGFDIRTYRLCRRVLLFHKFDELPANPYLVSALELDYADFPGQAPTPGGLEGFTYLKQARRRGYLYDEAAGAYTSQALPPLHYFYQPHEWNTRVDRISGEDISNAPAGLDLENFLWIDLFSEGLSGILAEKPGAWYYKRNLGQGSFAPALQVAAKPSFSGLAQGSLLLEDLSGAGDLYLVSLAREPKGSFRLTDDETWQPFQPFQSVPNRDLLNDPNVRLIDLNGDGLLDLLITEDELFVWHASLGEEGFGPPNLVEMPLDEEAGPRLVFSDPLQTIFLADMDGDGLTDLVRIRNGEICYWSNLGYGRFNRKIMMAGAPRFDHPETFNPAFVRLADIDGTGPVDLIYLGKNDFRVWMNLNGNRWSAAPKAIPFPAVDSLVDIEVLDLLGTGTAALVWSSPLPADSQAPLRYIDLMNSKKPHLLTFFENNMGKEVTFDYLPSTYFYLQDRRRGQPWATKLPFPVHVVAGVTVADRVRGTVFRTTYSYHHGYFDGVEREFRGFGRVEQLDTEEFSVFKRSGAQNVVEEALHQPPVRSVSWFHTGAALQHRQLGEAYEAEYYQNAGLEERALPPVRLPPGLDDLEWAEALRACKGQVLRQEVFALDGSEQQPHPYSTAASAFEIRLVQPRLGQKYASFQVIGGESISYAYDRRPADPRIAQSLILETDDRGFVTRSAAVVYPRRQRPPGLPDEVWNEQNKRHVVYSETGYTADLSGDDLNRLRTVFETRSYELLGIPLPAAQILSKGDLLQLAQNAAQIPFEDDGDGSLQKRLFGQTRTYFLKNDLSGPLPLSQRESLGFAHRSLQLTFTAGLVASLYGGKVTPAMLAQAGYEHSEGDADWWAPSGVQLYPPGAAGRFFIPNGFRDALGSESHVTFDAHMLLSERVVDAIGSAISVVNDYRTLSPRQVTDPNGNRSAVETDALGLVVRTAVMGKAGANEGDTLADPTVRMEYSLFNWVDHRRPNFLHTFTREQHGPANPRWQESYTHYAGDGSVIMTKIQAEPGLAKRWNPVTGQVEEIQSLDRWVGSGRTIQNNKGNPIKQFEPYFSATPDFESEPELVETGVTSLLFYDPIGRNFRTELPNGTFTKTEFDPWKTITFDANDTVRDSRWYAERGSPDPLAAPEPADPEQRAAWLAARHHGTPAVIHADSLGRAAYSVADYGSGHTAALRVEKDLAGRFVRIFDQMDRQVSQGRANLAGTTITSQSPEKGQTWIFQDVLGRMARIWDNDLHEFRTTYDPVHRPLSAFVRTGGGEALFHHYVYGENHPDAVARNLRGLPYQLYDQSGLVTIHRVDFKGNPLAVEQRLARDYRDTVDWQALEGLADPAAILAAAAPSLEAETFTASSSYDALSRPLQVTLPDGTILRTQYNRANYLDRLEARLGGQGAFIPFVEDQNYNARGQRELARLGNGVLSRFFYDPTTFRLSSMLTTSQENDPPAAALQNIRYTYDPVGNLTQLTDDAQQTHFFRNQVVRAESKYEYDAVYQLVRATGREHAGLGGNLQPDHTDLPFIQQLPHDNNAAAVRTYTETYEYDDLGNILSLRHQTGGGLGDWTRRYRYAYQDDPADRTNRLSATSLPGDPDAGPFSAVYTHDNHGNMTQMPHLAELVWNFMDQLRQVDLGGGGRAFYVYATGGRRIRKVIERIGGGRIEKISLGGVEIRRERNGANPPHLERWTTHITAEGHRVAQVDMKTVDPANSDPGNPLNVPVIRYQHGNHLGSATLETNEAAAVISYEEYHPFGSSAYRSSRPGADLSLKRYRFSGKERDDETGFYDFGARYYAAWLGRWISADPGGLIDGMNLYQFTRNNPIYFRDASGLQSEAQAESPLVAPPPIAYTGTKEEFLAYMNSTAHVGTMTATQEGVTYNFTLRFRVQANDAQRVTGADGREFWQAMGWSVTPGSLEILSRQRADETPAEDAGAGAGAGGDAGAGPGAGAGEGQGADAGASAGNGTGPGTGAGQGGAGTSTNPASDAPAATHAGPATEKAIWNGHFRDRGFRLEHLYNNDIPNAIRARGDNRPMYDVETDTHVKQVKSTTGSRSTTTAAHASKATRDAGRAVAANPTGTMSGKSPQAVVITPTDAPATTGADIQGGHNNIRKPVPNSSAPEHVRGLPGRVGAVGRTLTGVGTVFSGYALYNDIQTGDVPMGIGDAFGVAGGSLELYAIAAPGATVAGVSAMTAGIAVGGVGIAITSGVSGYRAYQRGDYTGAAVGAVGVLAGAALTVGVIVGSPALLIGGAIAAVGVGLYHLGKYFEVW